MPEPDSDDIMHSADPAIINDGNLQFMSDSRRDESTAGSILGPAIAGFGFKSDSDTEGQHDDDLLIKKAITTYRTKNSKTAFERGYLGSTSHFRQAQKIPRIHNAETISKDNTEGHEARMSQLCADLAPKMFHRQRPGSEILFNHRSSFARGSKPIEDTQATGQRILLWWDDSVEIASTAQAVAPAKNGIPVHTYNERVKAIRNTAQDNGFELDLPRPSLPVLQDNQSPANKTAAAAHQMLIASGIDLSTISAVQFNNFMHLPPAAQRKSIQKYVDNLRDTVYQPHAHDPVQGSGPGSSSSGTRLDYAACGAVSLSVLRARHRHLEHMTRRVYKTAGLRRSSGDRPGLFADTHVQTARGLVQPTGLQPRRLHNSEMYQKRKIQGKRLVQGLKKAS
ncbi:hypothetical protein S40293_10762 [Stachybotrys chartarum IBT 40293]|nr:hypothetical protein S40293_10762 [Stachybotrys chartarum IBT 40293]